MRLNYFYFFLLLLLPSNNAVYAKTKIDSLPKLLTNSGGDSVRIAQLYDSSRYYFASNPDSAFIYIHKATELIQTAAYKNETEKYEMAADLYASVRIITKQLNNKHRETLVLKESAQKIIASILIFTLLALGILTYLFFQNRAKIKLLQLTNEQQSAIIRAQKNIIEKDSPLIASKETIDFDDGELSAAAKEPIEHTAMIEDNKTSVPPKQLQMSKEDVEWMEEFRKIISSRIKNPNLTIGAVAQEIGLSTPQLIRRTKSLTGMTPMQIIQEIRFKQARKLLEAREYSTAKRVAYSVGFKDYKNFSRNYKKRFGKNPSDYYAM